MKLCGGRTDEEKPGTQIVDAMVSWVTAGFSAPGVHEGSGSAVGPRSRRWQLAGTVALNGAPTASAPAMVLEVDVDVDADGDEAEHEVRPAPVRIIAATRSALLV